MHDLHNVQVFCFSWSLCSNKTSFGDFFLTVEGVVVVVVVVVVKIVPFIVIKGNKQHMAFFPFSFFSNIIIFEIRKTYDRFSP